MTSQRQVRPPVSASIVHRDLTQWTSCCYQLWDNEDVQTPEAYDILIRSSDGTLFTAHKQILCESSEFFRLMFASNFVERHENECYLQMVDRPTLSIVLDHIYRKDLSIPLNMVLPVFAASHFFSLSWLQAYCATTIARRPFETTLEHPSFLEYVETQEGIIDLILDLDLLLTSERLRTLIDTWQMNENYRLQTVANLLLEKSRQKKEMAVIFDRSVGYAVSFTGNQTQKWHGSDLNISPETQHIAVTRDHIYYATGWLVGIVGRNCPVFKESDDERIVWPPLLRQYGSSAVIWTELNRRTICRHISQSSERSAENQRFSLRKGSIVRHIPSTDLQNYKHITVIVTTKGTWQVLRRNNHNYNNVDDFNDLGCPLQCVECAAILLDRLYVIGSRTGCSLPKMMLAYDEANQTWVTLAERKRDLIPRAFVPLNGRLYILANGIPTVEVYEPSIDSWALDAIHEFMQIGGFTVISGQSGN